MNLKAIDSDPGNRVVCILGSEGLFHDALSFCIVQKLGAQCISIDDPSKARDCATIQEHETCLFLINGLEMDYDTVIGDLQSTCGLSANGRVAALFNVHANAGIERRAFELGIRGFFYVSDKLAHLVKGLDALLRGEVWVSRGVLVDFARQGGIGKGRCARAKVVLTDREMQIIALVSIGASNDEIAERLFVSRNTVKTHLYNIFKKVGVPNRLQAALWAAKNL